MYRHILASLALSALVTLGCRKDPTTSHEHARLDQFETHAALADKRLSSAEQDVIVLRQQADELEAKYTRVNQDYARATRILNQAAVNYGEASQQYARARDQYQQAARNWRIVTVTLMVAATSDALNGLCEGQRSTAEMRREWKKQGYDLEGRDVDHIWPKSRGGANHPWNYQSMESRLNRSLGNDIWWKLQHQPISMLKGAVVSALVALRCG